MAWTTIGPATFGGRHAAERLHVPHVHGIGPRARCESFVESWGARHRRGRLGDIVVGGGEEGGEVEELETHLLYSRRQVSSQSWRRRRVTKVDKGGLHSSRKSEGNVVAAAGEAGQKLQGVAGSHRVHEREAEQAFGDHGAQAKIDVRGLGMKFRGSYSSEVDDAVHETSEELRKLTVERWKAEEEEELRVSDTSKAVLGWGQKF